MTEDQKFRIEAFLFLEARLMDENRYSDWLQLFADECEYWIPSNAEDIDPDKHVSIMYCDRPMLNNHVERLVQGKAFAQSPQSRMRRIVGNVEIEEGAGFWRVENNFIVIEVRNHIQRLHGGRSRYELIEVDGEFRIKAKKVLLVGIDEHQESVTFLI